MIILENLTKAKFSDKTTNMSYYDDFLDPKELKYMQKEKNRDGKIVQMTPKEYYEACAKDIFGVTVDHLLNSRKIHEDTIEKYRSDMRNGDVFPLCFLNYATQQQEGLHRMLAAGEEFGWDVKYPVLVITTLDQELEDLKDKIYELKKYFDWNFKEDLSKVVDVVGEDFDAYRDYPPKDMTKILQKVLYEITDRKLKARVYVDYDDVGDGMMMPVVVHFEPVIYDGLNVDDYIYVENIKNNYVYVEDMFYFPTEDLEEMKLICQPIYDDAEVDNL